MSIDNPIKLIISDGSNVLWDWEYNSSIIGSFTVTIPKNVLLNTGWAFALEIPNLTLLRDKYKYQASTVIGTTSADLTAEANNDNTGIWFVGINIGVPTIFTIEITKTAEYICEGDINIDPQPDMTFTLPCSSALSEGMRVRFHYQLDGWPEASQYLPSTGHYATPVTVLRAAQTSMLVVTVKTTNRYVGRIMLVKTGSNWVATTYGSMNSPYRRITLTGIEIVPTVRISRPGKITIDFMDWAPYKEIFQFKDWQETKENQWSGVDNPTINITHLDGDVMFADYVISADKQFLSYDVTNLDGTDLANAYIETITWQDPPSPFCPETRYNDTFGGTTLGQIIKEKGIYLKVDQDCNDMEVLLPTDI